MAEYWENELIFDLMLTIDYAASLSHSLSISIFDRCSNDSSTGEFSSNSNEISLRLFLDSSMISKEISTSDF